MNLRTVAVVQARMTSSRLPGKVLLPVAGKPLIVWLIERLRAVSSIDAIQLAVPAGPEHEPLAALAAELGDVGVTLGSESDVLQRTRQAMDEAEADVVVRVTSDCPLLDPSVTSAVIAAHRASGLGYARTSIETGYPHGFDTEVISADLVRAADAEATSPYEREHVTPFIWRRPERFPAVLIDHRPDRRHWRLVVDTPEDLTLIRAVFERLAPHGAFGYPELISLFDAEPDLLELNRAVAATPYLWSDPPPAT